MSAPPNPWLEKVLEHLAVTGSSLNAEQAEALFGRPPIGTPGKKLLHGAETGWLIADREFRPARYSLGPKATHMREAARGFEVIGRTASSRFRPASVWHYAQGIST